MKTLGRNETVTTGAAHRQLVLMTLDAERQTTYPMMEEVRSMKISSRVAFKCLYEP